MINSDIDVRKRSVLAIGLIARTIIGLMDEKSQNAVTTAIAFGYGKVSEEELKTAAFAAASETETVSCDYTQASYAKDAIKGAKAAAATAATLAAAAIFNLLPEKLDYKRVAVHVADALAATNAILVYEEHINARYDLLSTHINSVVHTDAVAVAQAARERSLRTAAILFHELTGRE